jgi:4'-phosphopantetheinyl transferase
LSPGERAVTATLRWPKRRSDWRLGRWVAKRAVLACRADEPGAIEPADIEILAQAGGAPAARVLADRSATPVSVSISHSDGMGLAVAAAGPIGLGCDVERIEPRTERFVRDYFTAAERERVAGTAMVDRAAVVSLIWSAKEAALKVLGEGLRLDTRAVDVECSPGLLPTGDRPVAFRVRVPNARYCLGWYWVNGGFVWTVAGDRPTTLMVRTEQALALPRQCLVPLLLA